MDSFVQIRKIIFETFHGRSGAGDNHLHYDHYLYYNYLQSGAGKGGGWSEKERGGAGQEVGRPRELH